MGSARYLLTALLLAVLVTGCSGTVAGQGSYVPLEAGPATTDSESAEPTSSPPAPTATEETETTSAAPTSAAPTSAAPTTGEPPPDATTTGEPPPDPPPPSSDSLSDEGWVADSIELSEDIIGGFQGTAVVTNTADAPRSALFTFTVFVGEDSVASLIGSAADIPAGGSETVQLIGFDTFVEGPYIIDFQVDFTF